MSAAAAGWRLTHPAHVRPGDVTLIGVVESVETFGPLSLTVVTVGGRDFTRQHVPAGWLDVAVSA